MVILVFFLVSSVNRRLFRYFGSYSGISVIPVILVNRRTGQNGPDKTDRMSGQNGLRPRTKRTMFQGKTAQASRQNGNRQLE